MRRAAVTFLTVLAVLTVAASADAARVRLEARLPDADREVHDTRRG